MTWLREDEGYRLFFNRDELKSRAEALPPRVAAAGGVHWIAPVDPDGGGTWLATSERGLTIGVLNGNRRADEVERTWRSRGELASALIDARDPAAVMDRLAGRDLRDFRSFRLVAVGPDPPAMVAEWDGATLAVDRDAEARRPLVSSSFDETAVGRARRDAYARRVGDVPTAERLRAFHRGAEGGASAYTVAMERPEAATRSFTEVAVDAAEVSHAYAAGRPDLGGPAVRVAIARVGGRPASRTGAP